VIFEWVDNPGAFTFNNCHFEFDFGIQFPTSEKAVDATKNDLLYSNFNLPEETDPTILSRWVSLDYNTDLFGNPRGGAGAFYYPGIPPMIWNHVETNRPESEIPSTTVIDCTFDSTVPISLLPEPFDAKDFRQEDFIYATFGFVNQGSG